MAHVITADRIGQGWDLLIADRERCETFCIEVRCVLCGGICYTPEFYFGRAKLFSHYDCAYENRNSLTQILRERGITAHTFSRRN